MKHVRAFLLMSATTLSLSACGDGNVSEEPRSTLTDIPMTLDEETRFEDKKKLNRQ